MKLIGNKIGLISYWVILILIGIVTLSCGDENPAPTPADEYYVRYEIECKSIYTTTRYAQINMENNTSTTFNFSSGSWETTIGPVKKGFNAKLKGGYTNQSISNSYMDVKIQVSKNNGPFALKKIDASGSQRTLVEINYTIDF